MLAYYPSVDSILPKIPARSKQKKYKKSVHMLCKFYTISGLVPQPCSNPLCNETNHLIFGNNWPGAGCRSPAPAARKTEQWNGKHRGRIFPLLYKPLHELSARDEVLAPNHHLVAIDQKSLSISSWQGKDSLPLTTLLVSVECELGKWVGRLSNGNTARAAYRP